MSPNLKHDNQTLKQNQVVILQLLTVANFQLNGNMLKRLSSSQTSCSCREHIVQKSSLLKTDETSTSGTPLPKKHYGSKQVLKDTASFVLKTIRCNRLLKGVQFSPVHKVIHFLTALRTPCGSIPINKKLAYLFNNNKHLCYFVYVTCLLTANCFFEIMFFELETLCLLKTAL